MRGGRITKGRGLATFELRKTSGFFRVSASRRLPVPGNTVRGINCQLEKVNCQEKFIVFHLRDFS